MADITLQHIAETIRKPSYLEYIQYPLAKMGIENEFKKDDFFKNSNKEPVEFLVDNLTKLYSSEDISPDDNEKLEELLVFSVLAHDKHQDNLKKADEEERRKNAAAFAKLMEEQEREDKPILTAFNDAKAKLEEMTNNGVNISLPEMNQEKIQSIAKAKMEAVNDFAKKLNDPETRKQILDDTTEQLSKGMDAVKQTLSDVQSKGKNVATSFMSKLPSISSPMFGKKTEEPEKPEEPVNGGKRKSKKGGKRKSKKNKSKKNKSKKSKK